MRGTWVKSVERGKRGGIREGAGERQDKKKDIPGDDREELLHVEGEAHALEISGLRV